MYCVVCELPFSIEKGFYAVSESEKHKSNFELKKGPNQLSLLPGSSSQPALKLVSAKDSACTAELIWCMKLVTNNIPISTCQGTRQIV